MRCTAIASPIHVTVEVYVLTTVRDIPVFAIEGSRENLVALSIIVQPNHAQITERALRNHLDMFAIVMQASMGRIVNTTWMNVLLIYVQQDRYVMITPLDLHVFGKITDVKEAY